MYNLILKITSIVYFPQLFYQLIFYHIAIMLICVGQSPIQWNKSIPFNLYLFIDRLPIIRINHCDHGLEEIEKKHQWNLKDSNDGYLYSKENLEGSTDALDMTLNRIYR